MKRRKFLKYSALATGSIFIPAFLKGMDMPLNDVFKTSKERKLVIIQLGGGNDGLNSVVPYKNDLYYAARPTIAIPKDSVIDIGSDMGFNNALEPLMSLMQKNELSIINNVGYPNPDRSHFRSMDIWHTASDSKEYLDTGWIGRYLDAECVGSCKPYTAIELDDSLALAMKGKSIKGLSFSDVNTFSKLVSSKDLRNTAASFSGSDHDNVSYLYKTLAETISSADYLQNKLSDKSNKYVYPNTAFSKDLSTIAQLIKTDTDTRIYYVSLGGFDTHNRQLGRQSRLLSTYAEGLSAFCDDLRKDALLDDVLVMTFSEFGRRVAENGSQGTDHGTANQIFLAGGKLNKSGFFNKVPDLTKLENGDLKYEIDFRSVYATLLKRWLGADDRLILSGNFPILDIVS